MGIDTLKIGELIVVFVDKFIILRNWEKFILFFDDNRSFDGEKLVKVS